MDSNPEPFKPHYCQLLQLLSAVLQDHSNPTALYYCILTLTAITAFIGTEEKVALLFSTFHRLESMDYFFACNVNCCGIFDSMEDTF